jgi:hypothetical protein
MFCVTISSSQELQNVAIANFIYTLIACCFRIQPITFIHSFLADFPLCLSIAIITNFIGVLVAATKGCEAKTSDQRNNHHHHFGIHFLVSFLCCFSSDPAPERFSRREAYRFTLQNITYAELRYTDLVFVIQFA